jgi:hypothetical protein
MAIVDERTVRVGDRLYQLFYVDLPQLTEIQRFERLLDRARQALACAYPGGSIKGELQRRLNSAPEGDLELDPNG